MRTGGRPEDEKQKQNRTQNPKQKSKPRNERQASLKWTSIASFDNLDLLSAFNRLHLCSSRSIQCTFLYISSLLYVQSLPLRRIPSKTFVNPILGTLSSLPPRSRGDLGLLRSRIESLINRSPLSSKLGPRIGERDGEPTRPPPVVGRRSCSRGPSFWRGGLSWWMMGAGFRRVALTLSLRDCSSRRRSRSSASCCSRRRISDSMVEDRRARSNSISKLLIWSAIACRSTPGAALLG